MNKTCFKTISQMEKVLKVVADNTRLKILCCLLDGEKNVGELVKITKSSQSLVSHQLVVLKKFYLVKKRKEGNKAYYSLSDDHVEKLIEVVKEHVEEEFHD